MMERLARGYVRFARHPFHPVIVVAVVALAFAVLGTAASGFRPPLVHDEWSNLLAAETFASGRLTNPPHPMWRFFETLHVLQQPTYMSKYPPANALFIAAGWVISGHPIVGVWLGVVFFCLCVHWMLRSWIGHSLALGIVLAFAVRMGADTWTFSYWGGAVTAGAGALTVGALHRILEGRGRALAASLLGAGLILLANSRPFEGALVGVAVAIMLFRWWRRASGAEARARVMRILLPLCVAGTVGGAGMLVYNWRVTGNWFEMPYMTYTKARDPTPLFLVQTPRAVPASDDAVLERYKGWSDSTYRAARTPEGRVRWLAKFLTDFEAVVPLPLFAPFLLLPLSRRNRWTRFALVTITMVALGLSLTTYYHRHYAAPIVALVLALYGTCLRWTSRLRIRSMHIGRYLAIVVIVVWMALGLDGIEYNRRRPESELANAWAIRRQEMNRELASAGRGHLVIVRYGPKHAAGKEWVYNGANVDASPVVWARDRGPIENQRLLTYFAGRDAWLLEIDDDRPPFALIPYARAAAVPTSGPIP